MRGYFAPALIVGSIMPALAGGWQVETLRDPMTDRSFVVAKLEARSGPATLQVWCVNGRPTAAIVFERRVGVAKVGINFRFDDGPVVSRFAFVASSGKEVDPWLGGDGPGQIARAKRLRVQMFPTGVDPFMVEFNLTGAAEAVSKAKCRS